MNYWLNLEVYRKKEVEIMLHEYSNLYFPVCSIVISIVLVIIYFSKKNIKNMDNKYYIKILFFSLIEAILNFSILLLVHIFFKDSTYVWFVIANKILYITYILWISNLFIYFVHSSHEKNKKMISTVQKATMILDIIFCILIIFSKIDLVYDTSSKLANSTGVASFVLYLICAFYILLMIIFVVPKYSKSKNKRKYFPLWILIIIMIATLWIRALDPYINITSNIVSLISLIMFFTIENPDLKMLKQLQFTKNQVEKSNRAKSDFLSSMSHEIRTPLNAIVGYSQLIDYAESIEEAKENSKEIVNASNTLINMLSNVLDISLVEVNNMELKEMEYDLDELVQDVLNLFKYKMETKNLHCDLKIEKISNKLIGDADKIKRVLANLIDNAIKYTDKGKISLTINYEKKNSLYYLDLVVDDTGKGIDNVTKEHLFSNFNRANEYMDSNISGMGLGLSITKSIIELMDGSITCESTVGKGTKFIVKFKQKVGKKK